MFTEPAVTVNVTMNYPNFWENHYTLVRNEASQDPSGWT